MNMRIHTSLTATAVYIDLLIVLCLETDVFGISQNFIVVSKKKLKCQ